MSSFLDGRQTSNSHFLLGLTQVSRLGVLRDVREEEETEEGNGKRDDAI